MISASANLQEENNLHLRLLFFVFFFKKTIRTEKLKTETAVEAIRVVSIPIRLLKNSIYFYAPSDVV